MDHQDINDVVWKKNKKPTTKSSGISKNKKLEDDNEELKVDKVSFSLKNAIRDARIAKKLTQKQLAQMINEKADVIQNYENGKAIPDQRLLNKLRRILNAKLKK